MTRATLDPRLLLKRLERAHRVLIVGHRNPDGDSLGSAIGLADLAGKMGVEAVLINHDEASAGLKEIPGADQIQVTEDLPSDFPAVYDLVITVECTSPDRSGFDRLHRVPILNIDHHHANELYGELNFVDEDAPAAGELVWRLFEAAPVTPSADTATALFAALSTDTGDFRYSNATGVAFRAAAEMVDWGAEPTLVADLVHCRRSVGSVRLLGEALSTLSLYCKDRVAILSVDSDSFERAGAAPSDTEDIINVPRNIAGVEIVAFFKQSGPDSGRVSLRSKGALDVRSVAVGFAGGGHTSAAGYSYSGDLESAKQTLIPILEALVEAGP